MLREILFWAFMAGPGVVLAFSLLMSVVLLHVKLVFALAAMVKEMRS